MATQIKTNPDYSNSSVITNHPDVIAAHIDYSLALLAQERLEAQLQELPEFKALQGAIEVTQGRRAYLEGMVALEGGYQNIEIGAYALQQNRETITYSVEKVKEQLPKFADIIIKEVADKAVIEGLIKGKLLTAEQVDGIVGERKIVKAWIIK